MGYAFCQQFRVWRSVFLHCGIDGDKCDALQQSSCINLMQTSFATLIVDAAEGFFAAEHVEHVENAGRGRPTGQRRTERLRHLAELEAVLLGKGANTTLQGLLRPRLDALKPLQQCSECLSSWPDRAASAACVSRASGRLAKRYPALSRSSTRVLARSLRPGRARSSLRQPSAPMLLRARAPFGSSGTSAFRRLTSRHRAWPGDNARSNSRPWRSRNARPTARSRRDRTSGSCLPSI